ncbi:sensor histidine kinase [Paenibacillus sp. GCM10012303]|uniref:sensor histidine kinase n=1 Tax=Paenibacillus sp. GCM10012303 TaxID=3317340 RepID=UPI003617CE29
MKSLYSRIVVTFVLIALFSGVVALFGVNLYYQQSLKSYNEQKIANIAKEIRSLYGQSGPIDLHAYFSRIASMGFQLYAVDEGMKGTLYGPPFKRSDIDPSVIQRVQSGETYIPTSKFVTGLFENTIRHSVGIPFQAYGQTYALFVRPNMELQFGEVRTLAGLLLAGTFLLSLLFIFVFTRYIVKPVEKLTEATTAIVQGQYDMELDVLRRDEIGNLARHFSSMAKTLQKLDDMRQEFVSSVSHEIQSPLTSIQGFAQAVRNEPLTSEERDRYLEIIEEESRRLSSLGKQLLTLASLDKEADIIKKSAYRLDEQLRQVVLQTEWQRHEKEVLVELDAPEMMITADRQLLNQVWLNLLTNGIKFSDPGQTIRIKVTVGTEIAVTVSDQGIGIPEAELGHIFERFYKADKARNRTRSGSGLGLSIALKIVQLHGGTIEAHSRPGEGTTFVVRLPHL